MSLRALSGSETSRSAEEESGSINLPLNTECIHRSALLLSASLQKKGKVASVSVFCERSEDDARRRVTASHVFQEEGERERERRVRVRVLAKVEKLKGRSINPPCGM